MASVTRPAAPNDFPVVVDGIGTFVIGRRAMRDQIKINVAYAEMLEGVQPTPWLDMVCTWLATIRVMAVRLPDGFDLDNLDPLEDETYAKLRRIAQAIAAKEDSFRGRAAPAGPGAGQGSGGDGGVLVSSQVQPAADRPALPGDDQ